MKVRIMRGGYKTPAADVAGSGVLRDSSWMATRPAKPTKLGAAAIPMPTLAEVTAWYRELSASGTYRSKCDDQAFFYDACWSNDAEIERVFEASIETVGNPRQLPFNLFEAELVRAERFTELHAFLDWLDAAQLARAVPMMRAFVAKPRRAAHRHQATSE